jgi:hypothetical protein
MEIRLESDVQVPMRDGVALATDIWIPRAQPAPVLLVRLPYGKSALPGILSHALMPNILELVGHGYAVVWQDCRGTFASGGEFTPIANEAEDGLDTIAWLRDQPWCDGNIGTYGGSYLGFTQWTAATRSPEGLRAQAPSITCPDFYAAPWYSEGGALSWHTLWTWSALMALRDAQRAAAAGTGDPATVARLAALVSDPSAPLALPPAEQELLAQQLPWWKEYVGHPDRDEYWQGVSVAEDLAGVTVPTLHVGGWFDIFVNQTVRTFTRMKTEAGSFDARQHQRLVIGPWDHLSQTGVYHDRQFGLTADAVASGITRAHVQFFDRWVRGQRAALEGTAPVRIFVMGIDQWRDESDWPLPGTSYTDYFLDGAGQANTAGGDGTLRTSPPEADARDSYLYDPARPVPAAGGRVMAPAALNAVGPVDQRPVEERPDVLCYTTAVLDGPVEVTGPLSLVLHVTSSAVDTDFTAKLVDVHPDGRALYLSDGILRARYRESLERPEPLAPGERYEVTVDLGVTANVFLPGHRIRLEVSSSNFPRFDRNTNTGGDIAGESAAGAVPATNEVWHGPACPSRLVLPVIRR